MIAVIADDLSGAAELAGIAYRGGLRVEVQTEFLAVDADVVVLDTASRRLCAQDAAERVAEIAKRIAAAKPAWVYKKVDSVLRGAVRAEIEATIASLSLRGGLLVSANPQRNRRVIDGQLYIDGQPLDQSDFRDDPDHPARTSSVVELLGGSPPAALVSPDSYGGCSRIAIGNAQRPEDLKVYARLLPADILPAGGVEFFTALLRDRTAHFSSAGSGSNRTPRSLPLATAESSSSTLASTLLVAGTAAGWPERIRLCRRFDIPLIEMVDLSDGDCHQREMIDVASAVERALSSAGVAMVAVGRIRSREAAPENFAATLAEIVAQVVRGAPLGQLLIEGGDTASAIVRTCNWTRFNSCEGPAPEVPAVQSQEPKSPPLIVKPGSYPWPQAVWESLRPSSPIRSA